MNVLYGSSIADSGEIKNRRPTQQHPLPRDAISCGWHGPPAFHAAGAMSVIDNVILGDRRAGTRPRSHFRRDSPA